MRLLCLGFARMQKRKPLTFPVKPRGQNENVILCCLWFPNKSVSSFWAKYRHDLFPTCTHTYIHTQRSAHAHTHTHTHHDILSSTDHILKHQDIPTTHRNSYIDISITHCCCMFRFVWWVCAWLLSRHYPSLSQKQQKQPTTRKTHFFDFFDLQRVHFLSFRQNPVTIRHYPNQKVHFLSFRQNPVTIRHYPSLSQKQQKRTKTRKTHFFDFFHLQKVHFLSFGQNPVTIRHYPSLSVSIPKTAKKEQKPEKLTFLTFSTFKKCMFLVFGKTPSLSVTIPKTAKTTKNHSLFQLCWPSKSAFS